MCFLLQCMASWKSCTHDDYYSRRPPAYEGILYTDLRTARTSLVKLSMTRVFFPWKSTE